MPSPGLTRRGEDSAPLLGYLGKNFIAAMRFLDTNILLYAYSPFEEERAKRHIAHEILGDTDNVISAQVLQEFYWQSTRPSTPSSLAPTDARDIIEGLRRFPIVPITYEIVAAAITISTRYQLSYWDGAILAAARSMGCDSVYSEDLSTTQNYDGLRIINPFS